jgi:hypothetical protein
VISASRFHELALGLPAVSAASHFERTAFRVPRRIFVTLAADGRDANFRFDLDLQEAIVRALPEAFAPIEGGWGRAGWTRCDLARVKESDLVSALREAHGLASEPPPRAAKKKPAKTNETKTASAKPKRAPGKTSAAIARKTAPGRSRPT